MSKEDKFMKAIKEELGEEDEEEKIVEVPKSKEKKVDRFELVDLATQTSKFIRDTKTNKVFTETELLLEILNKLENIEKSVR